MGLTLKENLGARIYARPSFGPASPHAIGQRMRCRSVLDITITPLEVQV